jgi:hypothetical protein
MRGSQFDYYWILAFLPIMLQAAYQTGLFTTTLIHDVIGVGLPSRELRLRQVLALGDQDLELTDADTDDLARIYKVVVAEQLHHVALGENDLDCGERVVDVKLLNLRSDERGLGVA